MPDISDDIIVKASQGDLGAFETIYKTLAGFVYNVALRVTRNREDAQEVSQEVFLIMHRKLKEFRGDSSLKTWVYRITVNHAINAAKKSGSKNKTVEYEDSLAPAVENDVHREIQKEHDRHAVDQILNVLNEEQRVCVVLRNIEGLSYEEIAETLKININTVRSRLKRARERILSQKQVMYEKL
jgi:RNA polymerase sigma-70 factor (ECF subfamily)